LHKRLLINPYYLLINRLFWRTLLQAIEQALFRNIPKQKKPKKSKFILQPNAIDEWFDELPLANIRISTKAIYQTLKLTNTQIIPYKQRLYFLEKVHNTIVELASNLKKMNLNRKLPLDEKHQRIAILLKKLHKQTTIGYKSVLRDILACKLFFLCPNKQKIITLTIARIIRHHSLCLIASYQFYNAPRNGQWNELHQLFLLAHQKKLLNKKLVDPSFSLVEETTIQALYLQILLTAIADPYHMAQHHISSIFKHLEEWASLVAIQPLQDKNNKNALAINLSSDSQPTFSTLDNSEEFDNLWELDTSKLDYENLMEYYDNPEVQTTEINVELLKQLSVSWGVAPNRNHSRRSSQANLKIAIGLNNVHYVLNNYSEPEWLQENEIKESNNTLELKDNYSNSSFSSRNVNSSVKVNDIWGNIFQKDFPTKNTVDHSSTPIAAEEKQLLEWKMVNESTSGYCLLWDSSESVNAKVGELIAVCQNPNNKEGEWFVGTVRWLKCVDTGKVQVGVHIIAPDALAVSTAKFISMQEGLRSRAILLPAIPLLKQPKTLITTALGYDTRDQVILDEYRLINSNITSVKTKIVLLEIVEKSSHFTRFKYALAKDFYNTDNKSSSKSKNKDTLALDEDTEFDSIWDDL